MVKYASHKSKNVGSNPTGFIAIINVIIFNVVSSYYYDFCL